MITHKILQRPDTKGARQRIDNRLHLCTELREIGKVSIGARKGDLATHSLELTDTMSLSQRHQKKHLLGESMQRSRSLKQSSETVKEGRETMGVVVAAVTGGEGE